LAARKSGRNPTSDELAQILAINDQLGFLTLQECQSRTFESRLAGAIELPSDLQAKELAVERLFFLGVELEGAFSNFSCNHSFPGCIVQN